MTLLSSRGNDQSSKSVNPLEMLRAQLLAAELNVYYFDARFDYSQYKAVNIYSTIAQAESLLSQIPNDLNTYWSELNKQQKNALRAEAELLKNALDSFNNMGDDSF